MDRVSAWVMMRNALAGPTLWLLLASPSWAAQPEPRLDLFSVSSGLFSALREAQNRPCLHGNNGVEKAWLCPKEVAEGRMATNRALRQLMDYRDRLLGLDVVRQDAAISELIDRKNLAPTEWLNAAAFIVAGLPYRGGPASAEDRFQDNLERVQVQIYNFQHSGEVSSESGFYEGAEKGFYERAVLPGLQLYYFKCRTSPSEQERVSKMVLGAPDATTAAALLNGEFRRALGKAEASRE